MSRNQLALIVFTKEQARVVIESLGAVLTPDGVVVKGSFVMHCNGCAKRLTVHNFGACLTHSKGHAWYCDKPACLMDYVTNYLGG